MDRFPARSWDPDREDITDLLAHASVSDTGLIGAASNYVFLLALTAPGEEDGFAIYKPASGEAPLRDFPPALYRREVASYIVSEALGWRLTPPTIERDAELPHGSDRCSSTSPATCAAPTSTCATATQTPCGASRRFDWLTNNADRKGGHVLLDGRGHIWGIDHGLTFHVEEKLRTVIWDHAGEPVPPETLADIEALLARLTPESDLGARLAGLLEARGGRGAAGAGPRDPGGAPLPPPAGVAAPLPLAVDLAAAFTYQR